MQIATCLKQASQTLKQFDTARIDAELLLSKVLDKTRTYLFTWPEKELTVEQQKQFAALLARRQLGEPIAYILGEQEFWSLNLLVSPATLIPRPDTELLVEIALELLVDTERTILDLGTGTGAIALALASERPNWKILAVDSESQAVELAIENCRRLGFTNVEINRSDWYRNIEPHGFDLIVSNPPYIDGEDEHLSQGDVRFEPASALIAERNGLADIDIIVRGASDHLNAGGWLLLEHGYQQAADVQTLLFDAGFIHVETRRDLGGHERATFAQLPA
ncbi:peptide chain release factor N(5)-glutamine methyltransferase [Aurantivibrio plasticivorans]